MLARLEMRGNSFVNVFLHCDNLYLLEDSSTATTLADHIPEIRGTPCRPRQE